MSERLCRYYRGAKMSALVWALPTASYLIAAAYFWRRFAWRIAWKEARQWSHPHALDGGNVALGIFAGGIQAVAWPVTLFVLRGARTEAFYGFLREPHKSKKETELEQREAHIAQLERELNIRD